MRDYAIRNNLIKAEDPLHHDATVYSDEFDKKVDNESRDRLLREDHIVIEAWLAGFFNKDNNAVLRVLLTCSQDNVRVDRLANRESISIMEAKKQMKLREETNFEKWQRLYGNYDFFDQKYYNLVIDTYTSGPIETAGKVLDALGFDHGEIVIEKK
jgi:cytidylate kinase